MIDGYKDGYKIAALIVAAGRGLRAGGGLPKQYRQLGGSAVLARTAKVFLDDPRIAQTLAVIHPDDRELYESCMPLHPALSGPVHGGENRAESVLAGLRALKETAPTHVLIHDGARPFLTPSVLDRLCAALADHDGAVAAIPAVDAMRRAEAGTLAAPIDRDGLVRMQTPQAFRFETILCALEEAERRGDLANLPDDASAAINAGVTVHAVEGDPRNIKLTTPEDFDMAEALLNQPPRVRMGQGFDVHAFADGDHVMLCGVKIAHTKTLSGHSDADVGLHALTDALFGAIANGDIGRHFPPSDPQWKGADSAIFLEYAVKLVRDAGYEIANLDITLICERPKIGPHADAMRKKVAELCGVESGAVSVKATTTERLGFCGREEGIAAQASACLIGV